MIMSYNDNDNDNALQRKQIFIQRFLFLQKNFFFRNLCLCISLKVYFLAFISKYVLQSIVSTLISIFKTGARNILQNLPDLREW